MPQRIAHQLTGKWRSSDIRSDRKYNFDAFVQGKQILEGLKATAFRRPSLVQVRAIPEAALGKDLIVQSKSGTGKTCFFVIRALECLNENIGDLQILVIAPTREIAWQTQRVIATIGMFFQKLNCEMFIGGLPTADDVDKAFDCQIAVGTPGRLRHMIHLGYLETNSIKLLILDEADQLMTPSFLTDVNYIIDTLPKNRQTLAVSATFTDDVISVYDQHMKNPKVISIYEEDLALVGVLQFYHVFEDGDYGDVYQQKFQMLLKILNSISFSQCMVFTSSLTEVMAICGDLKKNRHAVGSISSSDNQDKRLQTMAALKESRIKVLVTSDLTARGIDAENVNLILSMDPAVNMETYVHRVGRAGRYGARGVSVALATDGREIQNLLRYKIRGNLTVYPLPDPIPYYLKKYEPPSPDLERAILRYDVKASYHFNRSRRNGNWGQGSADRMKSTAKNLDSQDEDVCQHSRSSKSRAVSNANLPDESIEGYMNPLEVKDNDKMMEKLFTLISEGEATGVDYDDCHAISNSEGAGLFHRDHTYCPALNGEDMLGVSNEETVMATKMNDFADHDERGMLTEFNGECDDNGDSFSCNDFFFDAAIEPVEENNLIKGSPQLSADVKTVETGDEDLNKDGSNNVSSKMDKREESSTLNVPEMFTGENNGFDVCNSGLQHIAKNVSKGEISSKNLSSVPDQKNGACSKASDQKSVENCHLPFSSMVKETPNAPSEQKSKQPNEVNGSAWRGKFGVESDGYREYRRLSHFANQLHNKNMPQHLQAKLSKTAAEKPHSRKVSSEGHEVTRTPKMGANNRSSVENSKCKELPPTEKNDLKSQNKESSRGAIFKRKDLASSNKKMDIKSGCGVIIGLSGGSNLKKKGYKSKDTIHEKYSSSRAVREPCYNSRNMAADSETAYRPRVLSSGVHDHSHDHHDGVRFCDTHRHDKKRSYFDHNVRSCCDRKVRSCSDRNIRSCCDRNMVSCNHNIRSCCDHFINGPFHYDHHNSARSYDHHNNARICDRDMRSHCDHCSNGPFQYNHNCLSSGRDHHHDNMRSCCDHHSRRSRCDYGNGHNHYHSAIPQQVVRDVNYHDSSPMFYDYIPPTLPSMHLDERLDEDFDYGAVLHEALLMSLM